MIEKQIESKLVREVRKAGGLALKLACPGNDGMPDRLILMPGGRMGFAELKAPGKQPRLLQLARHEMLRGLGFRVWVVDGGEQIDEVIRGI